MHRFAELDRFPAQRRDRRASRVSLDAEGSTRPARHHDVGQGDLQAAILLVFAILKLQLRLMDLLLQRRDCKRLVLNVCNQMLTPGQQVALATIGTIWNKLNGLYREFQDAEAATMLAVINIMLITYQ